MAVLEMKNKKKTNFKKAGGFFAIIVGVMFFSATVYSMATYKIEEPIVEEPTLPGVDGGNDGDADGDGYLDDWYVVQEISSEDIFLGTVGDFAVPGGETGWVEGFHLDYAQVPETVLANNATDWSTSGDADGYVDADNAETDLASENGAYIVMLIVHNDTAKDGGTWNHSRFRCKLTVSGDETISAVYEYNNSGTSGDAVVSAENGRIWIFYWWDDGVDGYRITDDGSLVWAIVVEERY